MRKQLNEARRQLSEALERQTATGEVLKVISSSPGDLNHVFNTMLENATRICEAKFGNLFLCEGDAYRAVAVHGGPGTVERWQRDPVIRGGPKNPLTRLAVTKQIQHIADIRNDEAYAERDPTFVPLADMAGARALLIVPMLNENELVGAISMYREEVRPFTDKQIELVQNFAAQAVIAIENTRLLNQLRQRTDDLTESLEQQTATSEVLRVIGSSPGALEPVFQVMLQNATRICGANFGVLFLSDGDGFRTGAMHNAPTTLVEIRHREPLYRPPPNTAVGRMARTKCSVHIADILAEKDYFDTPPGYSQPRTASFGGARTVVAVPMLKDDELVGAIMIYRQEVRPFTDKQIELVTNFAAQAVIAIENTRLLNELRQRTDDLAEALEQQTATAEILQVISRSLSETQPVFDAIVRAGLALFPGAAVSIELPRAGEITAVAIAAEDATGVENWRKIFPFPLTREYIAGVAIFERRVIDIADAQEGSSDFSTGRQNFLKSGYRAVTKVPMIRGDSAIGVVSVARPAPGPLSDKQLAILQTFADQAVIAIENARLLNELRESLRSRPPLPTCSRSSAARPLIYKLCSILWSNRPRSYARPIWHR